MPVLLNERLYKHKKAIRILAPLPPSGNVITLCIEYCIYFLIFHFPPRLLVSLPTSACSPCMHCIFILTLNGISSLEIRYQLGCPLLFQPRSEDSSYDLDTAPSSGSFYSLLPLFPSLTLSLYPLYLPPYLSHFFLSFSLTSEASPPLLLQLSLALNQMEHIKSGMHSRQWLL